MLRATGRGSAQPTTCALAPMAPQSAALDSVALNSVALNSVAKNSVAKNSVAKNSVAKNSVAYRRSLRYRNEHIRNPGHPQASRRGEIEAYIDRGCGLREPPNRDVRHTAFGD